MEIYTIEGKHLKRIFEENESLKRNFFKAPGENGAIYYFSHYTFQFLLENKYLFQEDQDHKWKVHTTTQEEDQEVQQRLLCHVESILQDNLPAEIILDLKVILYKFSHLKIHYQGRNMNLVHEAKDELVKDFPTIMDIHGQRKVVYDVVGKNRLYRFLLVTAAKHSFLKNSSTPSPSTSDKRDLELALRFQNFGNWMKTPKSKIILSIGGGGFRLFAVPTVLKIIDILNLRDNISEIWGCSGGAIAGGFYSKGLSPLNIEQMGHDFYNERYEHFIKRTNLRTFASLTKNILQNKNYIYDLFSGFSPLYQGIKDAARDYIVKIDPNVKKIPFYCVSTNNVFDQRACVLTEPENIQEWHKEYLVSANIIEAATASSTIPFIFPAQKIHNMPGGWYDGGFIEETPVILPMLKYLRDKNFDPNFSYDNVKIIAINLGSRFSEIGLLNKLNQRFFLLKNLSLMTKIANSALDSNLVLYQQLFNLLPTMDVKVITLKIGKLGFLESSLIPSIIQLGRKSFLNEMDELEKVLEAA